MINSPHNVSPDKKQTRALWISKPAVAVACLAAALSAQVEAIEEAKVKPKLRVVAHTALLGASVNNGLIGEKHKDYGKIVDLVLDTRSGRLDHVFVLRGGPLAGQRKARVPWSALSYDAKKSSFVLKMKSAMVDEATDGSAKPGKVAEASRRKAKNAVKDAAKKLGQAASGEPAGKQATKASPWIRATQIGKYGISSAKDELGALSRLFVEVKSGRVAFVGMATKGISAARATLVPWAALRVVQPQGKQGLRLQLTKDAKQLSDAPRLGDKGADLGDAKFRHKVYDFYGVTPPSFEPKIKKAIGSR